MSHIFSHFSVQATKWSGTVSFALMIIWCSVVLCTISSIFVQPFDRRQRIFWIALVILVPVLGILAYLPFALRKEEMPHIFMRKRKHSRKSDADESNAEP